jgi:hypothetical protein
MDTHLITELLLLVQDVVLSGGDLCNKVGY